MFSLPSIINTAPQAQFALWHTKHLPDLSLDFLILPNRYFPLLYVFLLEMAVTPDGGLFYTPPGRTASLVERLDEADETVGGGIVAGDGTFTLQFRLDHLGQLLTQLDTPLIIRVDVPHDTLGEDLVLVHG